MLELLLIRHGQTDWNVQKKIMGSQAIPLNETGRLQAQNLAIYLKDHPLDGIYTSPHLRAVETSEILSIGRGVEVIQNDALREIEHGQWVGKTFTEIRALPDYIPYYQDPHRLMGMDGESLEHVRTRASTFIESLRQEKQTGRYALVSHADWVKCALLHYLKLPLTQLAQFRIDNASISYLHLGEGIERIICINQGPEADRLLGQKEFL